MVRELAEIRFVRGIVADRASTSRSRLARQGCPIHVRHTSRVQRVRLAEKTIELSWCAQLGPFLKRRLVWFGLTQAQEFEAGFDAYTRLGGALFVLQFKASNYVLRSGLRRFYAQHHQLQALRTLGRRRVNSVFYVFPGLGSTKELSANPDLIAQSQLLNAASIPQSVGVPTTKNGAPRKSEIHYIDVGPGVATIHSEPTDVGLVSAQQLLEAQVALVPGEDVGHRRTAFQDDRGWLQEVRAQVGRHSIGGILLPPGV